jgi:hypothetical protein
MRKEELIIYPPKIKSTMANNKVRKYLNFEKITRIQAFASQFHETQMLSTLMHRVHIKLVS